MLMVRETDWPPRLTHHLSLRLTGYIKTMALNGGAQWQVSASPPLIGSSP
jgi:hypothetical protein